MDEFIGTMNFLRDDARTATSTRFSGPNFIFLRESLIGHLESGGHLDRLASVVVGRQGGRMMQYHWGPLGAGMGQFIRIQVFGWPVFRMITSANLFVSLIK